MSKKKNPNAHRDSVSFTAKFRKTAIGFYTKVAQLTPYAASLEWVAWRNKSQDATLFFAWALADKFALSSEVVWHNKTFSTYGFYPDVLSYDKDGRLELLNALQLDDVEDEGDANGFAVYFDGKPVKLKGSTFDEVFTDAAVKMHVHACNSAMQAVRDAQRLVDLL